MYDCVTIGIFEFAAQEPYSKFVEPWHCDSREVTQNLTPTLLAGMNWEDFGNILIIQCEIIGDFKVSEVEYEAWKDGQLIARGSISYGNGNAGGDGSASRIS